MTNEQIKQNAHDYTYTNDHNWTWDDSGESRVDISAEISDAYIAGAHSRDKEIEELESKSVSVCGDRFDLKKQLDELTEKYENILYHAKRMAEEYNDEYNRYHNSTYDLDYFDYSGIMGAVDEFEEYCKNNQINL